MAYEDMTYEFILERMMNRVKAQYPNLDMREGSILYNALAPAAMEFAIKYAELDNVRNESFVNTATREYVLLACESMGMDISQFNATHSIHKAVFTGVEGASAADHFWGVPPGSRWNLGSHNYVVTELIKFYDNPHALDATTKRVYEYKVECETTGYEPNTLIGDLTPISDLPRVPPTTAEITECLVFGKEEATDSEIKDAYYDFVSNSVSDGNIAQYEQWCELHDDIGKYKILPLANGANTVEVCILDTYGNIPSEKLVKNVQNYFDPNITGMGNGVAPIGAFVTVSGGEPFPVSIVADISTDGTVTEDMIEQALSEYFSEIAFETNGIDYMKLGAFIVDIPGVEFISNMTVNGETGNIFFDNARQVPVIDEGGTYFVFAEAE